MLKRVILYLSTLLAGPALASQCNVNLLATGFGTYDIFSFSPTDTIASVNVICDATIAVRVILDPGLNASGFEPRRLSSDTGGMLRYNLYTDAARTRIWGDGTGNTEAFAANVPAGRLQVPIYARIPPRQTVTEGRYGDSVVVTLEW